MSSSVLYTEARDEAIALTKALHRPVEVTAVNCDCDYSKFCYLCGGEGLYFKCVYASCDHDVDDLGSCVEHFCAEREQVRSELKLEHPALRSCSEVASEETVARENEEVIA